MSVEQRLVAALRSADDLETSPDLWSRVVHSIEEDRRHRRRVRSTVVAIAATALGLVVVGAVSITETRAGRHVDRPMMELLELVALTTLIAVLGPAIRRFGRDYVGDLWPADRATPSALLRLIDLAYYLVFAGYVLLTTELESGVITTADVLGPQLSEAAQRVGGLLLVMGLLHALTIMVLPAVALVDNATRSLRPLPRWLVVGFGLLASPVVLFVGLNLIALVVSGFAG